MIMYLFPFVSRTIQGYTRFLLIQYVNQKNFIDNLDGVSHDVCLK